MNSYVHLEYNHVQNKELWRAAEKLKKDSFSSRPLREFYFVLKAKSQKEENLKRKRA